MERTWFIFAILACMASSAETLPPATSPALQPMPTPMPSPVPTLPPAGPPPLSPSPIAPLTTPGPPLGQSDPSGTFRILLQDTTSSPSTDFAPGQTRSFHLEVQCLRQFGFSEAKLVISPLRLLGGGLLMRLCAPPNVVIEGTFLDTTSGFQIKNSDFKPFPDLQSFPELGFFNPFDSLSYSLNPLPPTYTTTGIYYVDASTKVIVDFSLTYLGPLNTSPTGTDGFSATFSINQNPPMPFTYSHNQFLQLKPFSFTSYAAPNIAYSLSTNGVPASTGQSVTVDINCTQDQVSLTNLTIVSIGSSWGCGGSISSAMLPFVFRATYPSGCLSGHQSGQIYFGPVANPVGGDWQLSNEESITFTATFFVENAINGPNGSQASFNVTALDNQQPIANFTGWIPLAVATTSTAPTTVLSTTTAGTSTTTAATTSTSPMTSTSAAASTFAVATTKPMPTSVIETTPTSALAPTSAATSTLEIATTKNMLTSKVTSVLTTAAGTTSVFASSTSVGVSTTSAVRISTSPFFTTAAQTTSTTPPTPAATTAASTMVNPITTTTPILAAATTSAAAIASTSPLLTSAIAETTAVPSIVTTKSFTTVATLLTIAVATSAKTTARTTTVVTPNNASSLPSSTTILTSSSSSSSSSSAALPTTSLTTTKVATSFVSTTSVGTIATTPTTTTGLASLPTTVLTTAASPTSVLTTITTTATASTDKLTSAASTASSTSLPSATTVLSSNVASSSPSPTSSSLATAAPTLASVATTEIMSDITTIVQPSSQTSVVSTAPTTVVSTLERMSMQPPSPTALFTSSAATSLLTFSIPKSTTSASNPSIDPSASPTSLMATTETATPVGPSTNYIMSSTSVTATSTNASTILQRRTLATSSVSYIPTSQSQTSTSDTQSTALASVSPTNTTPIVAAASDLVTALSATLPEALAESVLNSATTSASVSFRVPDSTTIQTAGTTTRGTTLSTITTAEVLTEKSSTNITNAPTTATRASIDPLSISSKDINLSATTAALGQTTQSLSTPFSVQTNSFSSLSSSSLSENTVTASLGSSPNANVSLILSATAMPSTKSRNTDAYGSSSSANAISTNTIVGASTIPGASASASSSASASASASTSASSRDASNVDSTASENSVNSSATSAGVIAMSTDIEKAIGNTSPTYTVPTAPSATMSTSKNPLLTQSTVTYADTPSSLAQTSDVSLYTPASLFSTSSSATNVSQGTAAALRSVISSPSSTQTGSPSVSNAPTVDLEPSSDFSLKAADTTSLSLSPTLTSQEIMQTKTYQNTTTGKQQTAFSKSTTSFNDETTRKVKRTSLGLKSTDTIAAKSPSSFLSQPPTASPEISTVVENFSLTSSRAGTPDLVASLVPASEVFSMDTSPSPKSPALSSETSSYTFDLYPSESTAKDQGTALTFKPLLTSNIDPSTRQAMVHDASTHDPSSTDSPALTKEPSLATLVHTNETSSTPAFGPSPPSLSNATDSPFPSPAVLKPAATKIDLETSTSVGRSSEGGNVNQTNYHLAASSTKPTSDQQRSTVAVKAATIRGDANSTYFANDTIDITITISASSISENAGLLELAIFTPPHLAFADVAQLNATLLQKLGAYIKSSSPTLTILSIPNSKLADVSSIDFGFKVKSDQKHKGVFRTAIVMQATSVDDSQNGSRSTPKKVAGNLTHVTFMTSTASSNTKPPTSKPRERQFLTSPSGKRVYYCSYDNQKARRQCYTSADGDTWSAMSSQIGFINGVSTDNGRLYGVSQSGTAFAFSDDGGVSWSPITQSEYQEGVQGTACALAKSIPNAAKGDPTLTNLQSGSWTAQFDGLYLSGRRRFAWSSCCLA